MDEKIKIELEKEKKKYLNNLKAKKKTTWTPNDILVYENHAEILLRDNKQNLKGICLIDKEDIQKIMEHKWSDCQGYARTTINDKTTRMHRFLFDKIPSGKVIDHINHNTLDNRKKNLRIVTNKENSSNCSTQQTPRIFKMC